MYMLLFSTVCFLELLMKIYKMKYLKDSIMIMAIIVIMILVSVMKITFIEEIIKKLFEIM